MGAMLPLPPSRALAMARSGRRLVWVLWALLDRGMSPSVPSPRFQAVRRILIHGVLLFGLWRRSCSGVTPPQAPCAGLPPGRVRWPRVLRLFGPLSRPGPLEPMIAIMVPGCHPAELGTPAGMFRRCHGNRSAGESQANKKKRAPRVHSPEGLSKECQ